MGWKYQSNSKRSVLPTANAAFCMVESVTPTFEGRAVYLGLGGLFSYAVP